MSKKYIFFIIVGFLIFIYRYPHQLQSIDSIISYITYPVLHINFYFLGPIKAFQKERKTMQQLRALVVQLHEERDNLQQEVIALQGQLHYVQDTHELHTFAQRYDFSKAHTAQVIARIFSEQQHFFLIDAGSNKGIEPDMVAIYKNCLLGRVVTVYPCYSKILLVTDRSCKVAVMCSQTKAQGIHEGINSTNETRVSFVSRLTSMQLDDMVVSSGEGLVFPRGFSLGRIKQFFSNKLHYTICVEPLIDFSAIVYCYIIKKENQ